MKKIFWAIEKAEECVLSFCILSMSVMLIANVVMRMVGKNMSFVEELSQILLIITSFVGLPYCVTKSKHINMSILIDFSPSKIRKILYILISILAMAFMLFMTKLSLDYVSRLMLLGRVTVSLQIPIYAYSVVIPVGFFLSAVEYLRTLIMNLRHKEVYMSGEVIYSFQTEAEIKGTESC